MDEFQAWFDEMEGIREKWNQELLLGFGLS